ncbi:hypothetical protein [Vagococcus lutrae]|nr:hypothetical protein [Vagococcus lutrae]
MNAKEKMQAIIDAKQTTTRQTQTKSAPKNDRKNMRKGPKIFNK